jgi:MerR family mercuric resistance operon transcriptional regulator
MFGIGKLSERTGCNIETIRYYEKSGLLPEPPRSTGGHRLYSDDHLRRLAFIVQARGLGFSLDQTRELLGLSQDQDKTCEDALLVVETHLENIELKIEALTAIRSGLKQLKKECNCCLPGTKAPDCSILECLKVRRMEGSPRD